MADYIDLDTPLELKVVWGNTYKPYTSTLRELLDVNHIPYTAVDVATAKHGRWNYHDSFALECSNCGWINYHNMGVPNAFKYCPNCGASMREGGDE